MRASVVDMWHSLETDAPEFAARLRALFDSGTNKTIATLRADGSPRISGIELQITDRVTLGMMPASRKLDDVRRDNRVAIHSPTLEPPADVSLWAGEAKLAGRLVEKSDGFELDITEAVLTRVADNHLVVESWHPGRGHEVNSRA